MVYQMASQIMKGHWSQSYIISIPLANAFVQLCEINQSINKSSIYCVWSLAFIISKPHQILSNSHNTKAILKHMKTTPKHHAKTDKNHVRTQDIQVTSLKLIKHLKIVQFSALITALLFTLLALIFWQQ